MSLLVITSVTLILLLLVSQIEGRGCSVMSIGNVERLYFLEGPGNLFDFLRILNQPQLMGSFLVRGEFVLRALLAVFCHKPN